MIDQVIIQRARIKNIRKGGGVITERRNISNSKFFQGFGSKVVIFEHKLPLYSPELVPPILIRTDSY